MPMQGKHLTYRELDERANQLARFLEANGVKPEQPVGVMLERSLELMVSMMAVLKAGGAFVPMDPEYPADRLALMAEDAEVSASAEAVCPDSISARANGDKLGLLISHNCLSSPRRSLNQRSSAR